MDIIRADARDTGFPSEDFDCVVIMGNSIGYIQEINADSQIMAEVYRLLRSGGWFLVDVADGDAVRRSFNSNAWHEIGDDIVVCRQRELKQDIIHAREVVLSKRDGLIRDQNYAVRLYESQTLEALLKESGFEQIRIHTGFSPHRSEGDYGFMNNRMLATGQKP